MPSFLRSFRRAVGVALVVSSLSTTSLATTLKMASERTLVPPGAASNDEAGWAVALDHGTLVVGSDQDNRVVAAGGAAFVYTGAPVAPKLQATLTASDALPGDNLGVSVAISGDAAIAGAFHRFAPTPGPGKAYVFRRAGTTWSQEARLVAPDGQDNDAFGWAVAIVGDVAVVGAPKAWSGSPPGSGGVYVFERVDGEWVYDTKLTRPQEYAFGWSVAFDGSTLAVGTSLGINPASGRVFVYVRDQSGTWTFQQQLAPADLAPYAEFGNSVAVSGNTLIAGAWFNFVGSTLGSAYVFERSGTVWTQTARFDSQGGALAENFGEAVAIDGDRAIVTDSGLDASATDQDVGAAFLFQRSATGWKSVGSLRATGGTSGDYFGNAVAIQGDAIAVGAAYYQDPVTFDQTGAAYVFQISAGSKLAIRNALPDNESKNTLQMKAKGLEVDVPFPGSPDDPTCMGGGVAGIAVSSSASGAFFGQDLPCANWVQTFTGYRYRDSTMSSGPCKDVYFRPGGVTTVTCKGRGPGILNFDLEPGVVQVPIAVRLTIGAKSYCTVFGGNIKNDGTDGRKFVAVEAGAPGECP